MVSLEAVRTSNANLKALGPGLVAIFVGGTSGLGELTAREFVRCTIAPKVYLVGRNQERASLIQKELKGLNPESEISFIQSDLSLLKNVDKVCAEIQAKEKVVNLLFMSSGFLSLAGRNETTEGLDKKLNLNYYSRFRFTQLLLPQLTLASKTSGLSRQVSVLAGGKEANLILDDLPLKTHYSVGQAAAQATTFNSLAAIFLANKYPGTTFVHMYPGLVKTNIMSGINMPSLVEKTMFFILKPFLTSPEEAGQRHLYAATSEIFKSKENGGDGSYLLNWNDNVAANEKVLKPYREKGIAQKVWEHTLDVFDKVCVKGEKI